MLKDVTLMVQECLNQNIICSQLISVQEETLTECTFKVFEQQIACPDNDANLNS